MGGITRFYPPISTRGASQTPHPNLQDLSLTAGNFCTQNENSYTRDDFFGGAWNPILRMHTCSGLSSARIRHRVRRRESAGGRDIRNLSPRDGPNAAGLPTPHGN